MLAIALVLVALVAIVLRQVVSPADALRVLRGLDARFVALAVLAQGVGFVGRGLILRSTAALAGRRIPLTRSVLIALGGASVNLMGGGAVGASAAMYRWARREGVTPEGAVLVGTMSSLISIPTVGLVGVLGAGYLLARGALAPPLATGLGLALGTLAVLATLAVWALRSPDRIVRAVRWGEASWARLRRRAPDGIKAEGAARRFYATLGGLRRGGWRGPATGDLIRIGADVLTLGLLFRAAGFWLWPAALLAGYGLPMLVSKLSPWPGAVGLVEGSMALAFVSIGLADEVLLVVILAFRMLSFWLPFVLGLPAAAVLERAGGDPEPDPARS